MAFKNKLITNPKTGNKIKFIQTKEDSGGAVLEIEMILQAHSKEPASHYHPFQDEYFEVLSGELTVRKDGRLFVLTKGDKLHIPKKMVHSMWNDTDLETIVNWKTIPALNTEYFLEIVTGLARDGKTSDEGRPNILQVALMANRFSGVFRLSRPPFLVQKILFMILTPIAYLAGQRPIYKKYIN